MNVPFLSIFSIGFTFMIASMLNVYPLSFDFAPYRPMMLMLVLIFWAMYQPKMVGVTAAFLVGLFSDLLMDTRLGHQAFCAVVVIFLLRLASSYTKRMDFASAWILAAATLIIYRSLLWVFELLSYDNFVWSGFWSLIISIVCFAPVYWVLIKIQNKLQKIHDNR